MAKAKTKVKADWERTDVEVRLDRLEKRFDASTGLHDTNARIDEAERAGEEELRKVWKHFAEVEARITTVEGKLNTPQSEPTLGSSMGMHLRELIVGVKVNNKIQMIKAVRALTNVGLKEAKDFVEAVLP